MKRILKGTALAATLAGLLAAGAFAGQPKPQPPTWVAATWVEDRNAVHLRWNPVEGATGYRVLRSETKGKDHKLLATVEAPQYLDKKVSAGVSYFYVLQTVAGEAASGNSEERRINVPEPKKKVGDQLLQARGEDIPVREAPASGVRGSEESDRLMALPPAASAPAAPPPPPRTDYYNAPPMQKRAETVPGPAKARMAASRPLGDVRDQSAAGPGPSYEGFGESFDEVWVISRPEDGLPPAPGDDTPGCGELRAVLPGERKVVVPLERTEVRARVAGYVSTVTVTQKYRNPYAEKIEAVYVFPLPESAAVSDFVMRIGERRIRGLVREREEAERVYHEARSQGYAASLLTQERPNVFTQRVANIEPGKAIDIDITYFGTLAYEDGAYSFVFPMVVGPRYNPAGSRGGVGAVARGAAGASGQATEVQYLRPDERSGHDIMVDLEIDAGVRIEGVESPSHAVEVQRTGATRARVRLRPADTLPNKDFVLRYRVAGGEVRTALVVERSDRGGFFTLMLQPPANLSDVPRAGQEMVFVIDVSGSMSGLPLDRAKAAATRAIQSLRPEDTFQIAYFANGTGQLAPRPLPATPENIRRGVEYLAQLRGGGGTEMLKGIQAALDFPHDPRRLRTVAFMTDGYVGNEEQIFAAVAEKLGPARIFSFGVGSSVNRYLLEGLARLGKGAVAYLLRGDSDATVVDRFYERVQHPALADIEIDWGAMRVKDVYPRRVPDLFVGRPVVLTGRFEGHGEAEIRVRGRVAGESQTVTVRAPLDDPDARHAGISRIWARARIADLGDAQVRSRDEGRQRDLAAEVRETALSFGLVSAYTAFVAVDTSRVTAGDHGVTVQVPVPVPDGVRYDTTVQGRP